MACLLLIVSSSSSSRLFLSQISLTDEIHLSTVNKNIYSDDLISKDARNLTHLWGINPVTYLAELQQQSRISKLVDLQKTLTTMPQSSTSTLEKDENLSAITNSLNHLRAIRVILSELKDSDIETATQFGRDIMLITNDLLLRVVKQIGQTNVQTPTFESVIAYIRSLIHTRSAHMRQNNSWFIINYMV